MLLSSHISADVPCWVSFYVILYILSLGVGKRRGRILLHALGVSSLWIFFLILPPDLINIKRHKFWSLSPLTSQTLTVLSKDEGVHRSKKGKTKLDPPFQNRGTQTLLCKISEGVMKMSLSPKIMYTFCAIPNKILRDIIQNFRSKTKIYLVA